MTSARCCLLMKISMFCFVVAYLPPFTALPAINVPLLIARRIVAIDMPLYAAISASPNNTSLCFIEANIPRSAICFLFSSLLDNDILLYRAKAIFHIFSLFAHGLLYCVFQATFDRS